MLTILNHLQNADSLEAVGVVLGFGLFVACIIFTAAAIVDLANEAAAMRKRRNRHAARLVRIRTRYGVGRR